MEDSFLRYSSFVSRVRKKFTAYAYQDFLPRHVVVGARPNRQSFH
ncbi:MAG: hypothetical protein OJF47_003818 [Nitrospira sp.]|nr:MAG: hypothetical protein OJF47_003818 [Nitrospira sp.]